MKTLAIDPGTSSGFALFQGDRLVEHLSFKMPTSKRQNRMCAWRDHLDDLVSQWTPDVVVIEKVPNLGTFRGAAAAYMHGTLNSLAEMVCFERRVRLETVNPGSWKKAIGSKMRRVDGVQPYIVIVNEMYGLSLGPKSPDEDIAASIGIGHWGLKNLDYQKSPE